MITMTARCGGCFTTVDAGRVVQKFRSFSGRDYGFGQNHIEIEWNLPEDWVRFDQIGCTYCPKCADEIWPSDSDSDFGLAAVSARSES